MSEPIDVALGKLQESVKNLGERELEHHNTVLSELKDIKENINPRLTVLEQSSFSKSDFVQFNNRFVISQDTQDKRLKKLEDRFIYYLGGAAVLVVLGIGAWQLLLTYLAKH